MGFNKLDTPPPTPENTSPRNRTEKHANDARCESGRVMILCFDGTGNKFGENSNIVRFVRSLVKNENDCKKQIVYYQPGIGTYAKQSFFMGAMSTVASKINEALAIDLSDHVKQGYQFIVQNYRGGDKICLFGFSRGAHTARVLAGMVHKVGILPKENIQQIDFAYNVFCKPGKDGEKLSREFKSTFALKINRFVSVDFVGVWDSVSSVGLFPRALPYSSANYAVKVFRHALALDEHRARFRVNTWNEIKVCADGSREQELDVDVPVPQIDCGGRSRDDLEYQPSERGHPDVKEVWFAGCHADVGGGSHESERDQSLSFVSLRWMIKECFLCKTGILFDLDYLRDAVGFEFNQLLKEMEEKNIKVADLGEGCRIIEEYKDGNVDGNTKEKPPPSISEGDETIEQHQRQRRDILDAIFDQLKIFWWFWWFLEFIPTLYVYREDKFWVRRRMLNVGRGRHVPVDGDKVLVHKSVQVRIIRQSNYQPKAHNWDYLNESNTIEYVD